MHILSAVVRPVCRTRPVVYRFRPAGIGSIRRLFAPQNRSGRASEHAPFPSAKNGKIISSPAAPAIAVDGDSLEIGSRRIRLMGIDAPEYDQFCKRGDGTLYPCGQLAADYLKTLTEGKIVTCRIHKQDKYKRDLCTCYVGNTDLNAEMIRSGNAVVYLESAYAAEEALARRSRTGIWNGIFMHPRLFRLLKYRQKKQSSAN